MSTHQTHALRSARYLLALSPEEKATLDQRCRELAAQSGRRVTLADVMRRGAVMCLDDMADQIGRGEVTAA